MWETEAVFEQRCLHRQRWTSNDTQALIWSSPFGQCSVQAQCHTVTAPADPASLRSDINGRHREPFQLVSWRIRRNPNPNSQLPRNSIWCRCKSFFLPLLNSDSLKYVFCKGIKFKHLERGVGGVHNSKIFFNSVSDFDCFISFK